MEYTKDCIKCGKPYKDKDEEAYYCESCKIEKERIAKEIDRNRANMPKRKVVSDLQNYEQILKAKGRVNINDL